MKTLHTRNLSPVWAGPVEPFGLMRNLLRWDPFQDGFQSQSPAAFLPSFDVKETADVYQFKADLPGIHEADLDINLTGNRLTIRGHREAEERKEGESWFASERSFGSFSRTFTVPEEVDATKVAAELRNGVLTLMVPKSPEAHPKKISVKVV